MVGIVRAPEFPTEGMHWFNVARPLRLDGLRGKLVLLDFWTFCCINCIQVLPTLRRVEQAYPDDVVVIGVHSPKFAAERDPWNVERAIARYGIAHPVVHDPDMVLWQAYAVRAWPTLVFVSPDGRVIGQASGEPDPDQLLAAVARVLDEYRREGGLRPEPLDLAPADAGTPGRLRFPGKIKPVPGSPRRWAVADAGHHQIVLLDEAGAEVARIGVGEPGFADGPAARARFDQPQGLVASAEAVFVADTGNHALRRIDLTSGAVTTLAGLGRRGGVLPAAPVPGRDTALASPWDLEIDGSRLYLANAGTHQLGVYDLAAGTVARLAGNGRENIVDGPAAQAQLAQPSGLALSPDRVTLYFADSETSSVRALDLGTGQVTTLVGQGLFSFGRVDGPFAAARLQHPLGVAAAGAGRVLVADSYNGAIRVLDLAARQAGDFDGGAFTCRDPVCLPLGEPAGVWAEGDPASGTGRVLVADTNNHRILAYDPAERSYRTWAA